MTNLSARMLDSINPESSAYNQGVLNAGRVFGTYTINSDDVTERRAKNWLLVCLDFSYAPALGRLSTAVFGVDAHASGRHALKGRSHRRKHKQECRHTVVVHTLKKKKKKGSRLWVHSPAEHEGSQSPQTIEGSQQMTKLRIRLDLRNAMRGVTVRRHMFLDPSEIALFFI